jgi:hypothetical protein
MIATVDSASSSSAQSAASQTSLDLSTTPDTLGAKAREAMIPCRCSPDVSFAPRKRTNSRRGGRSALCQNLKRLVPHRTEGRQPPGRRWRGAIGPNEPSTMVAD